MNLLSINRFCIFKFKLKTCNMGKIILFARISSHAVRKRFLDFFIMEHNHSFIRSSPVVPFCDKSVAFVNAGMNQFKGVFLGDLKIPCPKAANSQKCIRVGGKHNDLSAVGHDSYHHTFFEMLGNWSFGDYFKSTACELAWKLLTTPPFSLDPKRLYVTYFGGDIKLGLPADLETKEIWRSIGVNPDHIIQFGVKYNFWEMGPTGPCGPCTEIHYDHIGDRLGFDRVNQGYSDLTELWNIVFIQYNRNEDDSLSVLPSQHVDTGMGFERLVALLQQKKSNYDTDLFVPLFEAINKTSKIRPYKGTFGNEDVDGTDTAYRILADHTRMAVAAMADHMFPDQTHKLRRVLRKALLVSEETFKMKKGSELVKAVSNQVAEVLGPTYPEIGTNLKQVHFMIDHEYELFKDLKGSSAKQWQELTKQDSRLTALTGFEAPGLPAGYKELMSCLKEGTKVLSGDLAVHLYDTHGLDPDTMQDLAEVLGLEFMRNDFESRLAQLKEQGRGCSGTGTNQGLFKDDIEKLKETVTTTDDSFKYVCTREKGNKVPKYSLNQLVAKIEAVILKNKLIEDRIVRLKAGDDVGVVVDKTSFYSEAGGQESDQGSIIVLGNKTEQMFTINVTHVVNCAGYIVHYGKVSMSGQSLPEYELEMGSKAYVAVNVDRRIGNMCNHTTTHLLNAALRKVFTITCQKASKVTHNQLELHFSVFGEPFSNKDVLSVEDNVRRVISSQVPVSRSTVCVTDLLAMSDVNLLPGEVYPQDQIHLIQIVDKDLISKEACCGTHVLNTGDISEICLTNVRSHGTGSKVMQAVTGVYAVKAIAKGQQQFENISALVEGITKLLDKEVLDEKQMKDLDEKIQVAKRNTNDTEDIPYGVRCDLLKTLDGLAKKIKDVARGSLRHSLETEMKNCLAEMSNSSYIVHFLQCFSHLDSVPLQKATRLCSDLPVVVFAYSDGQVKARCCVPEKWVKSGVTAEDWMTPVLSAVGGVGGAPRGQDPRLIYNMTSRRVSRDDLEAMAKTVVAIASKTASNLFK